MADIYKVNSGNIVGGPGRLVVRQYDGTFPESISEVMALNDPYALTDGWRDLGATNDGITISRGFDTEDFEVDQVNGPVDTDITSWAHALTTTLAENTVENRQLALIGGTIVETPATFGTATTLTAAVGASASILSLTSATGFTAGSFGEVAEGESVETFKVDRVVGNTVYLTSQLTNPYTVAASVRPITELGSKRIGFGTVNIIPFYTYALISQKKDGKLVMAVIRKAKVSGDDKEQTYSKEKRTIPLALTAFPEDSASTEDNVYYEIEQV